MVEIIPTIIGVDFQEVEERIRRVEDYVPWVQLDIMDGQFVEAHTWNNPSDLASLKTSLHMEADLMVVDPLGAIIPWLDSKVERIFVQIEPFDTEEEVHDGIRIVHDGGKKIGLTLNVETPIERCFPFIQSQNTKYQIQDTSADWVLLRGGTPGSYGQPFQNIVIEKVRALRRYSHAIKIMIDGGVRLDLVPPLKEAGVNALAVGSAIWRAESIKEAVESFKKEAA